MKKQQHVEVNKWGLRKYQHNSTENCVIYEVFYDFLVLAGAEYEKASSYIYRDSAGMKNVNVNWESSNLLT